jgi:uncharacterized peroxidase-related enzyme
MPRIAPNATPDPKAQELLDGVKKLLGGTPNVFTTLAHSPAALGVFVNALGAMSNSRLGAGLREQIAVAVAGASGCDYCASAHTALGAMHKIDAGELTRNLQAHSGNARVEAALAFARTVVEKRGRVSDGELEAVRRAGYSDGEIIDIVALVAVNLLTNYVNQVAGTDIDFPVVTTSEVAVA